MSNYTEDLAKLVEDSIDGWAIVKGYGVMHLPCNNDMGQGWIMLTDKGVQCHRCEAVMATHIAKYFILMFPDRRWLKQYLKAKDERTTEHD